MRRYWLALAAPLAFAGCGNTATLSLASSGVLPVQDVQLAITEVQLRNETGQVTAIASGDTRVHDFEDFATGNLITLLTDQPVPAGHYTGIALIYAPDSAQVIDANGAAWPISMSAEPAFAPADFTVARKDSVALWASLDLRLSLSDQTSTSAHWQFVPHLEIADLHHDATLAGAIGAGVGNATTCLQGRSNHDGAAVYLWPGAGVAPHDESPNGIPALATSAVTWNSDGSGHYQFPQLPPGTYTLALNCVSSTDDPQADQVQGFAARGEVTLGEGDSATLDFNTASP